MSDLKDAVKGMLTSSSGTNQQAATILEIDQVSQDGFAEKAQYLKNRLFLKYLRVDFDTYNSWTQRFGGR